MLRWIIKDAGTLIALGTFVATIALWLAILAERHPS